MLAARIGKRLVGAMVLALANDGRLDRADPVAKHLGERPWFCRLPNRDTVTRLDRRDARADRLHFAGEVHAKDRQLRPQQPREEPDKLGGGRRMPHSVRLTVVAWTLIRTSPALGCGFGRCRISRTSGDP